MSVAKVSATVEVVGCKILSLGLSASDRMKVVKVYVTVIQSGAAQLVHPTSGQKLFEIDPSFAYIWAFFNERINNVPKDCKLIIELRLLDHETEKEIKFASCVISSSVLSEDIVYFDLSELESKRADAVSASVGLRVISATRLQQMRLVPERWDAIGRLRAVLWRARKISSTYPVYLTMGLAVAGMEKHKSSVVTVPRDPIFDHVAELDVCSMQGDLIIALWEVHSVRSHKQLGQIIFPLSWLANMSAQSRTGTDATISGWFQFLPLNKPTAYNNGGQYRPYIHGTPAFTGFGLDEPEKDKCVGYLRVCLSITLKRPLFRSLFFQPSIYAHETAEMEFAEDDSVMAIVASMIIAKNNMMQIYHKIRYPMWLSTFFDIVRWREHPLFTFITIYFWTYLILVAPTWQFPIIGCLFFIFIGFATSRRRNFNSSHLYIPEMDVDTSEESTLREKYNKLKSAAYTVASLVESTRIALERLGNIFTWADPMLTLATIVLLLSFCVTFSMLLSIFPPHDFIFCSGMMAFVPEDFLDYSIALYKEQKRKVKRYIKHRRQTARLETATTSADDTVSSTTVSQVVSINDADAPAIEKMAPRSNIFIHGGSTQRRRASVTLGAIAATASSSSATLSLLPSDLSPAGHVRSSFLLSQYWERGVHNKHKSQSAVSYGALSPSKKNSASFGSDSELKIDSLENASETISASLAGKHWSSRWCEVWKAPPALAVTSKIEGDRIFINLERAVAHYIGGLFIAKSQRRDSLTDRAISVDVERGRSSSASSQSGQRDDVSPRKELFGFRRTVKAAINKRRGNTSSVLEGLPTASPFLTHDASDMENRDSTTSSISNMSGIINSSKDNAYKEIFCFSIIQQGKVAPIPEAEEEFEMIFACNSQAEAQAWVSSINSISGISSTAVTDTIVITKPIRSAGGGSVNSSQDADSDNDEITSESMRRKIQAYMLNWLSLAPDDMELAHRYFCRSLQYSGTFEHAISKGMRNPFVNSPSVFPLAMKNSNTELDAVGLREPGEPYISVTLLSARNLTHADSSSSFDIISGLYYMYCDLWVSPIKSPRLRSSKQPSVEHPVFRDELSFPLHGSFASDEIDNIYINKLVPVLSPPKLEADILSAANKIFLHCNVYNHKPLSIGDDELIGSTTISIKRLGFTSSPSEPIYEWFPLLDNKGEPVLDSAAVRLKVQLLN